MYCFKSHGRTPQYHSVTASLLWRDGHSINRCARKHFHCHLFRMIYFTNKNVIHTGLIFCSVAIWTVYWHLASREFILHFLIQQILYSRKNGSMETLLLLMHLICTGWTEPARHISSPSIWLTSSCPVQCSTPRLDHSSSTSLFRDSSSGPTCVPRRNSKTAHLSTLHVSLSLFQLLIVRWP